MPAGCDLVVRGTHIHVPSHMLLYLPFWCVSPRSLLPFPGIAYLLGPLTCISIDKATPSYSTICPRCMVATFPNRILSPSCLLALLASPAIAYIQQSPDPSGSGQELVRLSTLFDLSLPDLPAHELLSSFSSHLVNYELDDQRIHITEGRNPSITPGTMSIDGTDADGAIHLAAVPYNGTGPTGGQSATDNMNIWYEVSACRTRLWMAMAAAVCTWY